MWLLFEFYLSTDIDNIRFRGTEVRAAGYSGLKQIKTPQISIE